jgi:hypothetical protein
MCGGGYAPPTAARLFPGYALGRAFAFGFIGQGHSPKVKKSSTAGHSRRRTSDGKAEATMEGFWRGYYIPRLWRFQSREFES